MDNPNDDNPSSTQEPEDIITEYVIPLTLQPPPGLGFDIEEETENQQLLSLRRRISHYRTLISQALEAQRQRQVNGTRTTRTTRPTADPSAIDSIERFKVKEEDLAPFDSPPTCAICFECIEVGQEVMRFPCNQCHQNMYHTQSDTCRGLDVWLSEYDYRCPICRYELPQAIEEPVYNIISDEDTFPSDFSPIPLQISTTEVAPGINLIFNENTLEFPPGIPRPTLPLEPIPGIEPSPATSPTSDLVTNSNPNLNTDSGLLNTPPPGLEPNPGLNTDSGLDSNPGLVTSPPPGRLNHRRVN